MKIAAGLVVLACCVVGCDKKRPASAYEDPKREQEEQIAAGKKAYSEFADDVAAAIKTLEAGTWANAEDAHTQLKEQNERLHKKLAEAKSKGLSELKKFQELQMDGDNLMRLFNGPVETAHFQIWERKDSSPEKQIAAVRKGCEMNLGLLHKTLDAMKAKIEGTAGDTKKADEKKK